MWDKARITSRASALAQNAHYAPRIRYQIAIKNTYPFKNLWRMHVCVKEHNPTYPGYVQALLRGMRLNRWWGIASSSFNIGSLLLSVSHIEQTSKDRSKKDQGGPLLSFLEATITAYVVPEWLHLSQLWCFGCPTLSGFLADAIAFFQVSKSQTFWEKKSKNVQSFWIGKWKWKNKTKLST